MPKTKSPSLFDLQKWMRWVLTHPHGVKCVLKNHRHPLQGCAKVIGETPSVSRQARLSIYGNGYFSRIVEVLESNYSSVKNVLGENIFDDLARDYLIKHPSTFKSIDDIGGHLSQFLKKHSLLKKYPFLSDLALLEWAAHQSFFADDLPALDPKQFKNISAASWQKARFVLDPSARLVKLNWPVDALWRADGKWTSRQLSRMKKTPLCILVYRRPNKFVRVPRLSRAQHGLLSQLAQGKTMGKALLGCAKEKSLREDPSLVGMWFNTWIADGVFKGINFQEKGKIK